ncbi:MAG: iron chelate uptake ABC transporter family permease subunit [Caldilineaceae bacterium SB0661_bin_32]|uniref:Iron chelate uptake ABC transporter family permease subunit n=1 Tax=Caldilineaceae bacterium SB0661_bin_32 TaxID=2605255 RepID=A0A6B1D841_9CHLR|nr:iron chelate uptake ABC transporter family permease subunit [Caldilineaceae bacterium SB0661_bin_32]
MSTHSGPRPASGRIRDTTLLGLALVSLTAVSAWSLFIGVSDIGLSDLLRAEPSKMLLFAVSRVPRLAAILLSGSAMGVVGLIMQSLVRNRFVAPTTAGTVDAASLGLVIAAIWLAGASVFLKMTVAVVFALAGTALFMALVQRLRYADIIVVPLIGIMLGGVIQAAATFLALRYDLLQSLSAWTNGDFSGILRGRYELLYLVGAMTAAAYLFANRFTLAGMGRDVAVNLGVNYLRVLYGGMALAASVAAVVVVVVGGIPFLGLVVPNLVTMTMGDNLRRVLPLTAVSGAFFVLACDIVSRTIRFPYEIPVGTVVGVVGGGLFLALVLRSRFNAG